MKTTVACIQFKAELMNKEANIRSMEKWIKEAKKSSPALDLVVFPELALTGYECEDGFYKVSEEYSDGSGIKAMARIAKENNLHIIFGYAEEVKKHETTTLYNSAAFINNKGEVIGNYRKAHLVDGVETGLFAPGDEYPVFETPFGKVGIMICWDSAFPEVARILAIKGAEIIAVPAAWEAPNDGDWDLVQSARSFDNVLYIVACNRVGRDNDLTFFGKSKIVGPLGRVMDEMDDREGFIVSGLDLDILPSLRDGYYTLLRDRRTSTYKDILKRDME